MSEFIFDLIAEAKRHDGAWIKCDDPGLLWFGLRFRVKPNTMSVAKSVEAKIRGTKDPVKIARVTLHALLLETEGIGTGDREATLAEAIDFFGQLPAFVAWLVEQANELANGARQEAADDLGN